MFFLLSDFDYTMYMHGQQDVTDKNIAAIKKFRNDGNLFAIASGRSAQSIKSVLPEYTEFTDFYVLDDGATILDSGQSSIHTDRFGADLVDRLNSCLSKIDYDGKHAVVCFSDGHKESPTITANASKVRLWFDNVVDMVKTEKVLEYLFSSSLHWYSYTEVFFNDDIRLDWISHNMCSLIDITLARTNKASAIRKLCTVLGVQKNSIVTVGDDVNDKAMINDFNGHVIKRPNNQYMWDLLDYNHVHDNLYGLIEKLPQI